MAEKGYLALVLNAHLPFVHHPAPDEAVAEFRLLRALTESYLPLLDVLEKLAKDGVPFRITMALSPTLLAMLSLPLQQERCLRHLDKLIGLAEAAAERAKGNVRLRKQAEHERERFCRWREKLVGEYRMNPALGWKNLERAGRLELITTAATHAFLPYIKTKQALRAQIENAMLVHAEHFGLAPKGIWLPECGYSEEVERVLYEYGIRYFFADSRGILRADPSPRHGVHAPLYTPNGLAAFGRDPEIARQVWSSAAGRPGLGCASFREPWGDTAFASDMAVKFYRMSGDSAHKDSCEPVGGRRRAAGLAVQFVFERKRQTERLAARMERKPLIVASCDAELFGFCRYEGPSWIDFVCRSLHWDQQTVAMITPSDYLAAHPSGDVGRLPPSGRGRGGFGDAWLSAENEWMHRRLHRMEIDMIRLADAHPAAGGWRKCALNQVARELMLAQSSDWAFILGSSSAASPYAGLRFGRHAARFERIRRGLLEGELDGEWLAEVQRQDCAFPLADYRTFRSAAADGTEAAAAAGEGSEPRRFRVLVLSWEYPPRIVGGLSRHVYELSRKLVRLGADVHVVTSYAAGCLADEVRDGVCVHRVGTYQTEDELDFFDWVMQLNLAMVDKSRELEAGGVGFDLIHAHDWLVSAAAKALKREFGLPLAATIHATEHGRNGGIHNEPQERIHRQERELADEADRVICCSRFMKEELESVFRLPPDKIEAIPNGIDRETVVSPQYSASFREQFARPYEKIVLFVGRLVKEKGAHVLIDSLPTVLASCPGVKLVIAGRGPMLEELKARAFMLGVHPHVAFAGFVHDEARNQLLGLASAAVFPSLYEPFGIVALEAMAAGVPVVVSETGGLREIVQHGVDGLTALPGDVHSLSEQLIRILQDERRAQEMARIACRKVQDRYNWEQIARKTLQCYAKAALWRTDASEKALGETAKDLCVTQ